MIEHEKIIAFINYNVQPLKKSQLLTRLLVLWVMSVPCAFLGAYQIVSVMLFGVLNLQLTIFSIKILLSESITPKNQNAFIGLHFTYCSIVLLFASYKCVYYNSASSLVVFFVFIGLYLLVVLSINILVNRNIKKGIYLKESPNNKNVAAFSFAGSFAAVVFSRLFLHSTNQKSAYTILSIILFVLALLTGLLSTILQKFYWQRKLHLE